MLTRPLNHGYTLVELTSAMAASLILALGFASVIVFSRQQLTEANVRVGLSYDQLIIDKYIRTMLTTTLSDSMQIFADAAAEEGSTPSSSGAILRAVGADSTIYHLDISNNTLLWMVDSIAHTPVDSDVADLFFTERTGSKSKILEVNMNLISADDTLACDWSMTLRN